MVPQRRPTARSEESAYEPPAPSGAVTLDRVIGMPTQDARALQARARAFVSGEAVDGRAAPGKWSARRTLLFAVGASVMLWAGIFAVGWAILKSYT